SRAFDPFVPVLEPLTTAYPVRPEMLEAKPRSLLVQPEHARSLDQRFRGLAAALDGRLGPMDWEHAPPEGALLGTRQMDARVQPFTLLLRSTAGTPLIRCVSPV